MSTNESDFDQLLAQLRQGSEEAAAELVQTYEPEVRRFIRFRLTTPEMRRFVDSLDVSQSVLAKFFVQLEKGAVDVSCPNQLRKLLLTMARNKIYDLARSQRAEKRDGRRIEQISPTDLNHLQGAAESSSPHLAASELIDTLRQQLTKDERYLVDQRLQDRPWEELAKELNATSEALRKRMTRALDRAASLIGLIDE
jgi:RNA polymerase sigma-70 factor (ECF subfamily)